MRKPCLTGRVPNWPTGGRPASFKKLMKVSLCPTLGYFCSAYGALLGSSAPLWLNRGGAIRVTIQRMDEYVLSA